MNTRGKILSRGELRKRNALDAKTPLSELRPDVVVRRADERASAQPLLERLGKSTDG